MVRRWSAVVIAVILIFVGLSLAVGKVTSTPAPRPITGNGPVVVIGVPGLSWHDISARTTPGLESLIGLGATGSVSVRATRTATCTPTAWLSLSAGAPAAPGGCTMPVPVVHGHTAVWPSWSRWQAAAPGSARIGALATTLGRHGQCVQAVGAGAALAAADEQGRVTHYRASVRGADLSACAVTFVDLGLPPGASTARRLKSLNAAMTRVPAHATVIITGLSDGAHPHGVPDAHLRFLLAVGPGVHPGTLWSSSTKQPGFLQAADVTATALSRGIPAAAPVPTSMIGQPLQVVPDSAPAPARVRAAAGLDTLLHVQHRVVPWLYAGIGLTALVLAVGEARAWRSRRPSPRWVRPLATFTAAVPVATFLSSLVPWWRIPAPALWLIVVTAAFAAAITAMAFSGPWRRAPIGPFLVVGVLTMLVLILDVMHGSRLQLLGMLGVQPILGGRYYGFGNVSFSVLATAALVVATAAGSWLAVRGERRLAAASIVLIGLAAAAVDAWPAWGADLGGPPALLIAVLVLASLGSGIRLSWRRIGLIVGAAVAVTVLAAVADWLRPAPSRTHLGRFVQHLVDGSGWGVISDKLLADIRLVFGTPFTPLAPIVLIAAIVLLVRRDTRPGRALDGVITSVPMLREGVIAMVTCWAIGFAINDSGVVIPLIGGLIAVPTVIGVHTFREEDPPDTA